MNGHSARDVSAATAHDVLKEARAVIADYDKWAKGYFAFDSRGNNVASLSRYAVCWCARGAVNVAGQRLGVNTGFVEARLAWALPPGFPSIANFNDHPTTTHEDVLALFDRAIEATKP